MATGVVFFCAVLIQTISCQCIGNPYNGYSSPGLIADYHAPGIIGNFGQDVPCFNPGFADEISFPGTGFYNPGFSSDIGISGPFVNGFGPDCGLYPEIGFNGPFSNPPGIDYGAPCGGPIGPIFDIGYGGPGYLNNLAPEIGFAPGFSLSVPVPYSGPCTNFGPNFPVGPALPSLPPLAYDVPLSLPCQALPPISPIFDPAPFPMPPTGISIFSDDLIIEGPVQVSGRMPFIGAVSMEGAFTSAGAGAVSYGCGDAVVGVIEGPAVATVAPSFGFAPALPVGSSYGYPGPGFSCANRGY